MTTSGTVSQTVFETRKIVELAFRQAKIKPQVITGEYLEVANDLLYLLLSSLINKGIKLWNIDHTLIPLYEGEYSITMPTGTVDILNCNLRTQTRLSDGTATSSEGTAANAFDGDLDTACTQVSADGDITMQFDEATRITTVGILPNASGTWTFTIAGSDDDITYTTLLTKTAITVVAGEWLWYDMQGALEYTYFKIQASGGSTILDVTEFVLQNTPKEIPLAQLNLDQWSSLPNKTRMGRPTQFWWNKQRSAPILELWQPPELQYTYAQLSCYLQRHIQDVGTLTQEIEVPQRWYLAIIAMLADYLGRTFPEVDVTMIPILSANRDRELADAWAGETDGSSSFLSPNISPYTR